MKNKLRVSGLLAFLGLLIIGALIMPAVSAKDLGAVGSDLPTLLSGQPNVKSVEFIVKGQDGSSIWSYRNTTYCTQAIEDITSGLTKALDEMESHNVTIVQATVTEDTGKDRISYELNLVTGQFEKSASPIASVKSAPADKDTNTVSGSGPSIILSVPGLIDTAGNGTPIGRSVTYWAHSVTNPTRTFIVMSTTAELHMYANGNWNNVPALDGATRFYVSQNNRDPPAVTGLTPGSYRSEGQFSGVRNDGSNYNDPDVIGGYFTIT